MIIHKQWFERKISKNGKKVEKINHKLILFLFIPIYYHSIVLELTV
jgi:hypothetical protein